MLMSLFLSPTLEKRPRQKKQELLLPPFVKGIEGDLPLSSSTEGGSVNCPWGPIGTLNLSKDELPIDFCRYATKFAGGSPAASHFLLLRQKKVTKEKATQVRRCFALPCGTRPRRRLRNSAPVGPQTVLADFPFLVSVPRRTHRGIPTSPPRRFSNPVRPELVEG